MFTYCLNNPIVYADWKGCLPYSTVDSDGDGEIDYYIYTFTYTTGNGRNQTQETGYVYIFVGKTDSYVKNKSNWPTINEGVDVVVNDRTHASNATMFLPYANDVKKEHRKAILEALLQYDEDYNLRWDRTLDSLLTEWSGHHRYAWGSERARDIDFDNEEEGKPGWYYDVKAFKSLFGW